ncbi:unnamed protein product, partial [marine sediment metagenome]
MAQEDSELVQCAVLIMLEGSSTPETIDEAIREVFQEQGFTGCHTYADRPDTQYLYTPEPIENINPEMSFYSGVEVTVIGDGNKPWSSRLSSDLEK